MPLYGEDLKLENSGCDVASSQYRMLAGGLNFVAPPGLFAGVPVSPWEYQQAAFASRMRKTGGAPGAIDLPDGDLLTHLGDKVWWWMAGGG